MSARSNWRRLPEVGTLFGIRFVIALTRVFGRTMATGFLALLALYYALASARTRRVSRDWLGRVGLPASFGNVVRHVHMFARVALDRLYFLQDRLAPFVIETHGSELIAGMTSAKRGAILLGSHLGSFEAMGAVGREEGATLSMVVDARSAERFGQVVRELAPEGKKLEVIPVDPDGISTALRVRQAISRGHLVGILADRAALDDERNVMVDFFSAPAALPAGPWLLAHTLGCPVFLVFGLFTPGRRYDLYCELFAERVTLDRADRQGSLARYAQSYATILERYARQAPLNWFNLYDFWRSHKNV